MKQPIFELLNDCKTDCMIVKKIAGVIPGYFIMTLSPGNQQQENNKSVYDNNNLSSSPLFINHVEKNCKHRTETGFCNLSKKTMPSFFIIIKSTLADYYKQLHANN